MENLAEYVKRQAVRGACKCGKCCDAVGKPEESQPTGHAIDLTFFKVAKRADGGGDREVFRNLVEQDFPDWLNGEEHNYMRIGADMGDQSIALMTIGLGHLLGVWQALSPDTMMPSLPEDIKQQMAGAGMVSLKYIK